MPKSAKNAKNRQKVRGRFQAKSRIRGKNQMEKAEIQESEGRK